MRRMRKVVSHAACVRCHRRGGNSSASTPRTTAHRNRAIVDTCRNGSRTTGGTQRHPPMITRAHRWVNERLDSRIQAETMSEVYEFATGVPTDAPHGARTGEIVGGISLRHPPAFDPEGTRTYGCEGLMALESRAA